MPRARNTGVNASPAGGAETVVCVLSGLAIPYNDSVDLEGSVDITIGTGGVAVQLRLREGNGTGGALIAQYGSFTVVAGNRVNFTINGVDTQPQEFANQSYCLNVIVSSASAASTVNNVYLGAIY